MASKSHVLNLRVTEQQRRTYERAAAAGNTSVSALVTSAADARAAELLKARTSMTVPADVFDELFAALDNAPALAPSLEKALLERRFRDR